MDIKLNYTFRRPMEVGELFDVMLVIVFEQSDEDTTLLESPRLSSLHGQKDSLALKTNTHYQNLRNFIWEKFLLCGLLVVVHDPQLTSL